MKNFNKKLTLLMALAAVAPSLVCAGETISFSQVELPAELKTLDALSQYRQIPGGLQTPNALNALKDVVKAHENQDNVPASDKDLTDVVGSTMNIINNVLAVKSFYDLGLTVFSGTKAAALFVSTKAQAGLVAAAGVFPTVQQAAVFVAPCQPLIPFVGVVTLTTAYLRNKVALLKAQEAAEEAAKKAQGVTSITSA